MPTGRSSRSPELTCADLDALARGAELLGGGGGGDPLRWSLLTRQVLGGGSVSLVEPESLAGDGLVIAAAMIGAPAIMAEYLPGGGEFVRAFQALERRVGSPAVGVMGLEHAGVNVFPPIMVAAVLGLPLLDLDGMGRAYPRLDHTVLHARGARCGPLVSTGVGGELVLIDVDDAVRGEALARACLPALGGWAAHACYPITVAEAARCALRGTLSRALELGRAAEGAADPGDLAQRVGARLLCRGRVISVERRDARGPLGTVLIEPVDEAGSTLRIELQTEYLLATLDGAVVAATPDPIVVVDGHGLAPIDCEQIRRGNDVAVLVLPADPAWREPAAMALAGPEAFGYAVGSPAETTSPSARERIL
jgi:DUF917 family protein